MNDSTTPTSIAVYCPDQSDRQEWIDRLGKALPDCEFTAEPDQRSRYAVVWSPPADYFQHADSLEACFSMGAGVDHLLTHTGLPPTLPLYRLEDAGNGQANGALLPP